RGGAPRRGPVLATCATLGFALGSQGPPLAVHDVLEEVLELPPDEARGGRPVFRRGKGAVEGFAVRTGLVCWLLSSSPAVMPPPGSRDEAHRARAAPGPTRSRLGRVHLGRGSAGRSP